MERNLFKYIWQHSRKEQTGILILVVISMPFYFLALDVPKNIINIGIQGEGFEGPGATQPFFAVDLPFGEALFGETVSLFEGFQFEQPGMLLALSFMFLTLVLINGLFKRDINTRKGRMGERMLRRVRFELTDRILRFPLMHMRRVKQSEMATMVKDEVEPLGGFIGDAFVTPAFLGGQAITAMTFIMVQSVWLGSVAAAIVLIQAFLIPKLRRRILKLGRERQLTARALAGRIGELVDGAVVIQAHDTSNFERADMAQRLGRIFFIRYDIYKRKFFVKFLNNLLAQITPFAFYAGGGLLAIYGHLDIGALVAVIAAYKDLPSPIKELIDWDQQRADVQIKYDQVVEQFQPASIIDPKRQAFDNDAGEPLSGDLTVSSVSLVDENDFKLLDGISFTAGVDQHLAIVGRSGSGKEQMAFVLAGLVPASGGSVKLGGRDVASLPSAVTGRRISFVGQDIYHFPTSVRENLLYGLKHRPLIEAHYEGGELVDRKWRIDEAALSGNPDFDPNADWIDYGAAGAEGPADIGGRLTEMLRLVELEADVYRFGLTGTLDPAAKPEAAEAILRARDQLLERLVKDGCDDLVIHFDSDAYNVNATLAENLLFGTPKDPDYQASKLAENPVLQKVLNEQGLFVGLLEMGASIAHTMVEILGDLPSGHPVFNQFSFIGEDDLPDFRTMVARCDSLGLETLRDDEKERFLGLPFLYVEARHRLGLIDDDLMERFVAARKRFHGALAESAPGAVEFYDAAAYNAAADLQDNILFGRIAYGRAQAEETVNKAITEVLDTMGLRDTVVEIGLDYHVGVGGKRLSSVQRQKLGIARALLKNPDILIVDEAVAVMDGATQQRLLDNILRHRDGRGVIWTLQRPSMARNFDRLVVMQSGRLLEQGSFEELSAEGTAFSELMSAE